MKWMRNTLNFWSAALFALALLPASVRAQGIEVEPNDPVTLGGVVILLLVTGLIASWIPARRGTRVDPMVTMRTE